MNKRNTSIAVLAMFAVMAPLFSAGNPTMSFVPLKTRDGLSNSSVSSIVQDKAGFLWFGTQGGLNRYDGAEFKLFEDEPFRPGGLSHNLVQTLYLDGEVLWVGTYGGLDRLDLRTEKISSYRYDAADSSSLSNGVVISVARDARGRLWVGTLRGLNRLDEASGSFVRYLHDPALPTSLPSDVVRDLHVDSEGRLWVATSGGGLARYDEEKDAFTAFKNDPEKPSTIFSDFVTSIDEDDEGALWIGTWFGGLSRFDPAKGEFLNIPMPDNRIYVVNAEEPGTIWIGSWGGGLFEYRLAEKRVYAHRSAEASGTLSHDIVYSIKRDRSGEMWFGTNGGGLNKLTRSRRSYESFIANSAKPNSLPQGKINALLVDSKDGLWAGVYNGGLNRYDRAKDAWTSYRHDAADPRSLPNDIVTSLYEDSSGELWVTTNGGFSRMDPKTGRFENFVRDAKRPDWLQSEVVYCLEEAREGGMWVGTYTTGLDYYDPESETFVHYSHDPKDPESISDNFIYDLAYDAKGRLWVATNRGLSRMEGGRFVRYLYDPSNGKGVSGNAIRSLFLDSRGILWIASTGGGLMRYESDTDTFIHYTKREGLPGNSVLSVLEDEESNLWISTQSGLVQYERASGSFRELTLYNELRDRELNSGAAKGGDGKLYFGSLDVIYAFMPSRYEYNDHRPPVAITSIKVSGNRRSFATAAHYLTKLDLSYAENALEFRFAALDFRDPERNRYSYRLEGFDKNWIKAEGVAAAVYTHLPGGRYTFRVKAANNDGLWNEEGARIAIRVATPFWLSPLAFLFYVAVLVFVVVQIMTRKSRAELKAQAAELLELKKRLEGDDANADARFDRR